MSVQGSEVVPKDQVSYTYTPSSTCPWTSLYLQKILAPLSLRAGIGRCLSENGVLEDGVPYLATQPRDILRGNILAFGYTVPFVVRWRGSLLVSL